MNGRQRKLALLLSTTFLTFLVFTPQAFSSPLSQTKTRLHDVMQHLDGLYQKSSIAVERYNEATAKLAAVKQSITENEQMLKIAQFNLSKSKADLVTEVVSAYKERQVDFLDVLLSTRSFDQLVSQMDVLRRLNTQQAQIVKSVNDYKQEITDRSLKLQADKKAAVTLVASATAAKSAARSAVDAALQLRDKYKQQINRIEAAQAAAAKAAAQAAMGTQAPPPGVTVDPGGPGHPEVVAIAQQYLGVPYVWGGASPSGFDCSGLVMYCYGKIGISLPHGATDQQHMSQPVSLGSLMPGDMVFFGGPSYSYHVGIYVGGGSMIEAPHTGANVCYGSISGAWIGGRL
jgi:cell wall-associated NlpC family hydrolase